MVGLKRIQGVFKSAPSKTIHEFNEAVEKSIYYLERRAKPLTPVRTGRLRASYQTMFGTLTGALFPTVDYAIYVHEGTRYMRARPFLREAVAVSENQIQKYFEEAINNVFKNL